MHWLPRGWAGKIFIKRKSLKAWVAKKGGGETFDKKNVLFEALLLNALVAKRGGGENFDKKKIIESMGCEEGGQGKF